MELEITPAGIARVRQVTQIDLADPAEGGELVELRRNRPKLREVVWQLTRREDFDAAAAWESLLRAFVRNFDADSADRARLVIGQALMAAAAA